MAAASDKSRNYAKRFPSWATEWLTIVDAGRRREEDDDGGSRRTFQEAIPRPCLV